MNESFGGTILFSILFIVFGVCGYALYQDKMGQDETYEKGIETEAFVKDKDTRTVSTMMYTGKVYVPLVTTKYELVLYALKNEYTLEVSRSEYDEIQKDQYLPAKVYKDRIVLLPKTP